MTNELSRRGVLKAGAAALAYVTHAGVAHAQTAGDFALLRTRWKESLVGSATLPATQAPFSTVISLITATANAEWSTMQTAPARTALWADLTATDLKTTRQSVERIRTMALAWAQPGSSRHNNTALRDAIVSAIQWIADNRYNSTFASSGNWWDSNFGIPQRLFDAMILMYPHISVALRTKLLDGFDRYNPTIQVNGDSTGANLTWDVRTHVGRGALADDGAKITTAMDALKNGKGGLKPVGGSDGYYVDGSFVQHDKLAYNGGYGRSFFADLSQVLYVTHSTPWAYAEADWSVLRAWVYSGLEGLMYRGAMMDMVRGREVARAATTDHAAGHAVIQGILQMAAVAPGADASAFKSMAKYWIATDTARTFYQFDTSIVAHRLTVGMAQLANNIQDDASIPMRGETLGHTQYHRMDKVVHRRSGWAFAISMYSARRFNYETVIGEHLHGWHTANGMTYLYNSKLTHYADGFWATVNPYRLAGTTLDTRPRADREGSGQTGPAWVGGASLGTSGAVGMHLVTDAGALNARKSWFCVGDFVACLGADITSTSGYPIETIIENRNLGASGTNAVLMNSTSNAVLTTLNSTPSGAASSPSDLSAASWLHIANVGGYVLIPDGGANPPTVRGVREARTGKWTDINNATDSPTTDITRRYVTLWIDHGANPTGARYAYVVLPGRSATDTQTYANAPNFTVLANSGTAQGVAGPYGVKAVNFWSAATVGGIQSSAPCSVFLSVYNGQLRFAISDPTHTQTNIVVVVAQATSSVVSNDPALSVSRTASAVTFTFNPFNTRGATSTAVLSL
ncbi:MAG: hypothetical protein EOO27_03665 [Comamonadaceae bacterium]|nr:MAG: hypothetical protein EOO27_03665 [Comamonadaceae bacterium]